MFTFFGIDRFGYHQRKVSGLSKVKQLYWYAIKCSDCVDIRRALRAINRQQVPTIAGVNEQSSTLCEFICDLFPTLMNLIISHKNKSVINFHALLTDAQRSKTINIFTAIPLYWPPLQCSGKNVLA